MAMPAHDWTRVSAGTFHAFHFGWIWELSNALNRGVLPTDYYAMPEQRAGGFETDLLALERQEENGGGDGFSSTGNGAGGTALAVKKPKARVVGEVDEASLFALKRRTLTIRHATNDRIVALLEIVSPGNKDRLQSVQQFCDKAVTSLKSGYHLVVIDLFPPRPSDPAGMTSAVWEDVGGRRLAFPANQTLSAASFRVAGRIQSDAEAFAVGDTVPELPLFYDPDWYVNLPLESTYAAAYDGVPKRWRRVIEAGD